MTTPSPCELSVIVASHNRRELLRRCLDSLCRQTQDPDSFEVIVAVDGSSDGSAEMAEALETPFRLRVLNLEKSGHAVAQNAAIDVARAPACLLLDDDVIASPGLIAGHVTAHRADPMTLGIGALSQEPVAGPDWYAHAFARGWNAHYEELEGRPAHWNDCYGANLSMPRQTLIEIGGVSTDVPTGKDFDVAFRLCGDGCTPRYLPDAHGVHDDQKRRGRMLEDASRQGRMHVELSRRYPQMTPELLGWFGAAGKRELALRRLLIALRVPPAMVAAPGALIPGDGRKMVWYQFVRKFAFWRAVRTNVGRQQWASTVHRSAGTEEDPAALGAAW